MSGLVEKLKKDIPLAGEIHLYWLGGAGYIIRTASLTIGLDLYLSDSCRNEKNEYKRIIQPPIDAGELELDFLIATHEHGDHFDIGSIHKIVNKNTSTVLIGPRTAVEMAKEMGIEEKRIMKVDRNEFLALEHMKITGVFADHGEYSIDAIGAVLDINGKRVYFTGDTCYRYDLPQLIPIREMIDLLIVPINGKFGNPDAKDASYITSWVKPRIVIPCHFWMFIEHGGDPAEFKRYCNEIAPLSEVIIPAIGEKIII